MDLYVGITKCLSEMSDTEIDRIAQVTEVQYDMPKDTKYNVKAILLCKCFSVFYVIQLFLVW